MIVKKLVTSILISFIFLCILVGPTQANMVPELEWKKIYEPYGMLGQGNALFQTEDEGFLIVGVNWQNYKDGNSLGSDGLYSIFLKVDQKGNFQWSRILPVSSDEQISVIHTKDKGFAVFTYDKIVKLDSHGIQQWNKSQKICGGSNVIETSDGKYISTIGNSDGFILIKMDEEGNYLCNKTVPVEGKVIPHLIMNIDDENILVVGEKTADFEEYLWAAKIDSKGALMWNKTYDTFYRRFEAVNAAMDGGYFLILKNELGKSNIVKFDSNCNIEWNNTYSEQFQTIVQTEDRDYYAYNGATLATLNQKGNIEWVFYLHDVTDNLAALNAVTLTSDKSYVSTGYDDHQICLLKITTKNEPNPTTSVPEFQLWTTMAVLLLVTSIGIIFLRNKPKQWSSRLRSTPFCFIDSC